MPEEVVKEHFSLSLRKQTAINRQCANSFAALLLQPSQPIGVGAIDQIFFDRSFKKVRLSDSGKILQATYLFDCENVVLDRKRSQGSRGFLLDLDEATELFGGDNPLLHQINAKLETHRFHHIERYVSVIGKSASTLDSRSATRNERAFRHKENVPGSRFIWRIRSIHLRMFRKSNNCAQPVISIDLVTTSESPDACGYPITSG